MESWRGQGSFRKRELTAERTTKLLREHRKKKVAARTHESISEFEANLKATQEAMAASVDDLPLDADAGHLGNSRRSQAQAQANHDSDSDSDRGGKNTRNNTSTHNQTVLLRTQSDSANLDIDARREHRPPSPLRFHDYGGISSRPRSEFAQRCSREPGVSARPKFRQTAGSCGHYFPGAEFKQGPYGFSMLDPVHMPPRSWEASRAPPTRWGGDPSDLRPVPSYGKEHPQPPSSNNASPSNSRNQFRTTEVKLIDSVRHNRAHLNRATLHSHVFQRNREDAFTERLRFERGVFEGRHRDPALDTHGGVSSTAGASGLAGGSASGAGAIATKSGGIGEATAGGLQDWLGDASDDLAPERKLASKILFGLESALRENRAKLLHLFRAENRGTPGVLEPEEFLRGLVRMHILGSGECTEHDIIEAMLAIDPTFDGRVNFPPLSRAVAVAQGMQKQQSQATQLMKQQHQTKLSNSYSESLPVDVVKVDWQARSLFDFERSFGKFRAQQKELLSMHNELPQ